MSAGISLHARALGAGVALWIAIYGGVTDLPGAGPQTPTAVIWAPFARAALLLGAPIAALALIAVAAVAVHRRRAPSAAELTAPVVTLLALALFSALFSPWGGINLQTGGGPEQTMTVRLGAPGGTLLRIVPPAALRLALVGVALLGLLDGGVRRIPSRTLAGAGAVQVLIALLLGGEALGGALFAPPGHRFRAAVMAVILLAAGVIGLRRRRAGATAPPAS